MILVNPRALQSWVTTAVFQATSKLARSFNHAMQIFSLEIGYFPGLSTRNYLDSMTKLLD